MSVHSLLPEGLTDLVNPSALPRGLNRSGSEIELLLPRPDDQTFTHQIQAESTGCSYYRSCPYTARRQRDHSGLVQSPLLYLAHLSTRHAATLGNGHCACPSQRR